MTAVAEYPTGANIAGAAAAGAAAAEPPPEADRSGVGACENTPNVVKWVIWAVTVMEEAPTLKVVGTEIHVLDGAS